MAEETKKVEEPKVEETKNKKDKITKVNMSSSKTEKTITKVDLSKPPTDKKEEVKEQPVEEVVVVNEEPKVEKEEQVIQEVTNEKVGNVEEIKEEVEEAIEETVATGKSLPENIQKVVDFMDETGGTLSDYVNLNKDLSKLDDSEVLDEYYRTTKSHLSPEERNFILEEKFSYDKEVDDPKDIKRKKIALKEQVAEARAHLDRQKSKYYEEIKAGSRLTPEAKKAMDFFNRYNKDQKAQKKLSEKSKRTFLNKTNKVFNEDFKGFDYQIGDKKFRFNVKDVDEVKKTQSDINNFINKYVDEGDSTISDVAGYHKSLFTAMNADSIAKHFYEQGKADAIKTQVAKDKNINLDPRKTHGETEVGGIKVKVLGESSANMKNRSFKIRKKN
tara:strand:- start:1153 stop:2313 length:1161 start_codon:yes stop_codon:yes gene_type:complete